MRNGIHSSKRIALAAMAAILALASAARARDGQIDIRPTGAATFTITTPGSYVLVDNITMTANVGCIAIESNDVTLDLNGHTIVGTGAGSGRGITLGTFSTAVERVTIKNGTIRNFASSGIGITGAVINQACKFEDLVIANNGVIGAGGGINSSASNSSFRNVIARGNGGGPGISAGGGSKVENCLSVGNTGASGHGFVAFGSSFTNCVAFQNGQHGFAASGSFTHCIAQSNTADGFQISANSRISDCDASGNGNDGIEAASQCLIRNNSCGNNGTSSVGAGIQVTGSNNVIEGNSLTGNDNGVDCNPATGNSVYRNFARGNTTANFDVLAGNDLGPVGTAAASTSPWANITF